MGLVLIIISSLSGIVNLITLFMIGSVTSKIQQFYQEINAVMPFSANNVWIYLVIFLVINILTVFYGRFLLKHPNLKKKYSWLSVLLLILILFGLPLGLKYLVLPILMNFYGAANVM